MKRLLVTGANGQLGLALHEAAKESNLEIVFMDKHSLDITNAEAVKEVFAIQSFDFCINTAAYTDVNGAETNKNSPMRLMPRRLRPLPKSAKKMGAG